MIFLETRESKLIVRQSQSEKAEVGRNSEVNFLKQLPSCDPPHNDKYQ